MRGSCKIAPHPALSRGEREKLFDEEQNQRGHKEIDHGNRKNIFPAEFHQLVIAEARKGPADQHKKL